MAAPSSLSRRRFLAGSLTVAGTAVLAGCTGRGSATTAGSSTSFGTPPPLAPKPGQNVVAATLTPTATTLDLGGTTVSTWAYGDAAPGPLIRASAGDLLRVTVDNQLSSDTSVHWHGIRLRNVADGVPGVTQDPIAAGAQYMYEFEVPDPGTYFFHPHTGVQLDRGLYAPLIIDDPAEPGQYDAEWIVVLDDWIDGTGTSPDDVLQDLTNGAGTSGGMGGMGHGSMNMGPAPFGDAGDVTYPYYVINGRNHTAPSVFEGSPGQRVRIRVINAASDTIFAVALGGHTFQVTHSDGFPVEPAQTGAFYIGMGERYDAIVTLGDGVFPLYAEPFNKTGAALAVVRTAAGDAPTVSARPGELSGDVLLGSDLTPAESALLPTQTPDRELDLSLNGQMQPYQWGMNGAVFGENEPLIVAEGERVRIRIVNMTMMAHPIHLHGHTFALTSSGLRKDTVLLAPMESRTIDLDADNAGDWALHCHNIYHAEAGMMTLLNYG
ncbi:multicopper oxidase family protein [Blastococcus sp. Marseille-P5729]|uniref:multicopper oxidase family protein n=1 Tax=Blastococcus sp. Marseille-P5729 TaxID=2086582 RepID=UPI000D10B693|nr:multicopper oxidase family protein [Blastococcus sp. Marseille-P5729]